MQIGFIKLHRQLLNWEWYDDINTFRLFTHLLLKANYEPTKWHGIDINIGQFLTSRESLAKQTGLTEQQVRTALTKLKSTSEITSQSNNNYTLITIINWHKWQQNNQPDNNPSTNHQPTDNQRITTTKEVKKERKKEEDIYNASGKNDFQKVYEAGSALFPRLASANTSSIHQWLSNECSVELDIIPELERQKGRTIGSWSFFTEPISNAKSTRLMPLPQSNYKQPTGVAYGTRAKKPTAFDNFIKGGSAATFGNTPNELE